MATPVPAALPPPAPAESTGPPWMTLWLEPRATVARLAATGPDRRVAVLAILAGVLDAFERAGDLRLADRLPFPAVLTLIVAGGAVGGMVVLHAVAALLGLTTRLLRGRATRGELRVALAWGMLPVITVGLPAALLQIAFFGRELFQAPDVGALIGPARVFLGSFFGVLQGAAALWAFVATVQGLAAVSRFSAWRALAAVCLAFLVALVPLVLLGIAFAFVLTSTGLVHAQGPPVAPGQIFYQQLSWSPDSRRIAFSGGPSEGGLASDVYVHDVAGAATTRLTSTGKDGGAAFAPDGEHIAFDSRRDGEPGLFLMRADGSAVARIGEGAVPRKAAAWSPDGRRLACMVREGAQWRIGVVGRDGGAPRTLSAGPGHDLDPAWSPDGRWIVYHSDRFGAARDQLLIRPAAGGDERQVTDHPSNNVFPWFRRDGRIVFTSNREGGVNAVFVMRPDGSGVERLVSRAFVARPSPDGRWIAALFGRWPNSRLALLRKDGVEVRQIAP